jgi:MoxR-like ATPase
VARAAQRVHHRLEVLAARRRQDDEAHAAVDRAVERGIDVAGATVDGHVVAARREPRRELLGERFEAAVRGRDAARAEDRDAQRSRGVGPLRGRWDGGFHARAGFRITAPRPRNRAAARASGCSATLGPDVDSGRAAVVMAPRELTLDDIKAGLARLKYFTTARVETAIFLAVRLGKPLLAEGPAGAGKTEIGKVLASLLDTELVRLQCYEGLDEARALYEWNYQKQLLRIQSDQAEQRGWEQVSEHIFSRDYLLERPLLRAITAPRRVVLLIDEVDKADEELEAFLLEVLSDFQVTVPELGTLRTDHPPVVVLTSNRARELSEALRRRCLHVWVDFPGPAIETTIVAEKVPGLDAALAGHVARFVAGLRKLELRKAPSIAETLDWARALVALGVHELDPAAVRATEGLLFKHEEDARKAHSKIAGLIAQSR